MSSVVIAGDTSGSITLQAPAVAGSTVLNLPSTLGNASTSAFVTTDASGNLGLGVTPNAQYSTVRALQIGQGAILEGRTNGPNMSVGANFYLDSSATYRYTSTDFASRYSQAVGTHYWYTAASGTAGGAVTFNQVMTLDASGNLALGTTTANRRFEISGLSSGESFQMRIGAGSTNSAYTYDIGRSTVDGYLAFWGNQSGNNGFIFGGANGERARIDLSGNLLVGTTSASAKFYVSSASGTSGNNGRFDLTGNSLTAINVYSVYLGTSNNNNNFKHFAAYSGDSGVDVFRVYGQGNVVNTNNSYGAISDVKLKENIVDATPKLADLMQVKVRNYNLIGDTTKQLGVVAQELETIFPAMVEESPDQDIEGNDLGTTTKQVKYSVFVPMLIKAIQEQQALINTLTERISVLENK